MTDLRNLTMQDVAGLCGLPVTSRPRCPSCGSTDLYVDEEPSRDDTAWEEVTVCNSCGQVYRKWFVDDPDDEPDLERGER